MKNLAYNLYYFLKDAFFITSDDPIVHERHPFGTVYMLPIDRNPLICLGYYIEKHLLSQVERYINQHNFYPENINIEALNRGEISGFKAY